jgi:hypothetical protein
MDWLRTLWSRCVAFFGERKLDDELDEELLGHIEFAVEENLRRSMSPQDARRAALLKFGGVAQIKETIAGNEDSHSLMRLFRICALERAR